MKKILGILCLGLTSASFAVVGDAAPYADQSDTKNATIKICNFEPGKIIWDISTYDEKNENKKVVIGKSLELVQGECGLIGLRAATNEPMSEVQFIFHTYLTEHVSNTTYSGLFRLRNFTQVNSFGNVTKTITPTKFSGPTFQDERTRDIVVAYVPGTRNSTTGKWDIASLYEYNNKSLKNLSKGVVPDFVICIGGDKDKCNDSYGMN